MMINKNTIFRLRNNAVLFITELCNCINIILKVVNYQYYKQFFVVEAKKEEKKAESESDDEDMGFGLFD